MIALTSGRSCGPCTVCCEVLEIAALAKPAGTRCRHSTGAACGIYPDRPLACARWFCLWRRVGALPDALRPDRSGVLFAIETRSPAADGLEGACIVGRVVDPAKARIRPDVTAAFAMFARDKSLPVWQVSGRHAVPVSAAAATSCGPANHSLCDRRGRRA